jgi:hypothetical protein
LKQFKKLVVAALILFVTIPYVKAIQDPTPGYYNLSEYMIGSITVEIIFPESNGTFDQSTQDWTNETIAEALNKTQTALDFWSSTNPKANVTFVTDVHIVPEGYEPIDHNSEFIPVWVAEVMRCLGYDGASSDYVKTIIKYLNSVRENRTKTDWACMVFFVNAGNTTKAEFPDGMPAHAMLGGPYMMVPVLDTNDLDFVVAHELAHLFWATDEYNREEDSGYLNVTHIFNSSGIMCSFGSWNISGKPDGFNGTWGQLGWRDANANGVEDIVDTPLMIVLDSSAFDSTNRTLSYNGTAAVTPYTNKNPKSTHRDNVTINCVTEVMYKVDEGSWNECNITPTTVRKEIGDTGNFYFKNTTAIVNFTFITPKLNLGTHLIQVKANDQWNVTSYANETVTITGQVHDIAVGMNFDKTVLVQGSSTWINVSVANLGSYTETFNITAYYRNGTLTAEQWNEFWSMGDCNRDGYVNEEDLEILAAYFSWTGSPGTNPADLNSDGTVDLYDQMRMADHLGLQIWRYFLPAVGTQTVFNLTNGNSVSLMFAWNTSGLVYGNYTITAVANPVTNETNTADNNFTGRITVTIPGDIDGNFKVGLTDLVLLANSYASRPGDSKWNPNADIDSNGTVGLSDLVALAQHYGQHYP